MIAAPPAVAEIAPLTAAMLWQIGAVSFRPERPFTLASGLPSPVYVDCRRIVAYPRARGLVTDFLAARLAAGPGVEAFDVVAGGETAGIPFAAFLAERLALPMAYVRKKPKGYGRDARIEGADLDGRRVLLVEDLATDGGSKLSFAQGIREAGGTCAHCAVAFFYGIFPGAVARLAETGLTLHALCTWHDVLAAAPDHGGADAATVDAVGNFLRDPIGWQDRHRTAPSG